MNPPTEQQVIEIIRRELGSYFNSDRSVIEKPLTQFLDGRNIQLGTGTGTKIGTGTNQKLGFFGDRNNLWRQGARGQKRTEIQTGAGYRRDNFKKRSFDDSGFFPGEDAGAFI